MQLRKMQSVFVFCLRQRQKIRKIYKNHDYDPFFCILMSRKYFETGKKCHENLPKTKKRVCFSELQQ
jgi:hypothetical protein